MCSCAGSRNFANRRARPKQMSGPVLICYVPGTACFEKRAIAAAAMNAAVADSAAAGAAADVRGTYPGTGGAIGAVVTAHAPAGALGAAHHDDDVVAGIWPDGNE